MEPQKKIEKEIQKKILELAPDEQKEVFDFIEFLENKKNQGISKNNENKIAFSWEGALSHLKDKYTSVELQHKISEWRI